MYKVCVYAICKNEEVFVDRWYNSMKEADDIYVLDTGSTDNTFDKLKKLGVHVKKENKIAIDVITINHYPDMNKSRNSYLSLLELSIKEDPIFLRSSSCNTRNKFKKLYCIFYINNLSNITL